jgi:hypothetical protein
MEDRDSRMIFYKSIDEYFTDSNNCDAMVVPVDCGSVPNAALNKLASVYGPDLIDTYRSKCINNVLNTGRIGYWYRGRPRGGSGPKYILFFPLSPNANHSFTMRAYVDCMSKLEDQCDLFMCNSVSVPYVAALGSWVAQEQVILSSFEGVGGELVLDVELYGDMADALDEVEEEILVHA